MNARETKGCGRCGMEDRCNGRLAAPPGAQTAGGKDRGRYWTERVLAPETAQL